MTWWTDDDKGEGVRVASTRARQRIKDLHRHVYEVRACEDGWLVLQPMSGWQRWRKVDAEWAELMEDGVPEPPNKRC
jgi:hypothetical protein